MLTSAEIRQQFLDFFKSKGHLIVPSAPIVVKNDPTLLFTNAGMNQFKDYFLGNGTPLHTRIADTQKCLRVSGKHNDLEEVGVDTYHHTMFEMLGNWSFGDYFKKEAIAWSWELLTEVYKLDKSRLYVSVFEGDEKEGLPASTIALEEWKKIVDESHIVFGNKKDNFWEMGDIGPCGPCSEIHIDLRSDEERAQIAGKDLVNKDHPQVIEIWNNVFMQYNRLKDGSLQPLPAQHVDTGMGFERLVRAIQGKASNYDTDVFSGTIKEVATITNKEYHFGDTKQDVAFRVIADHIRAIGFAIADGQLPSNTGAGYVIRRILRRAVRYYYSYLDYKQPLLFKLIPIIAQQFETVFPELHAQLEFVSKVVREEEEGFLRTLEKGLKRMEEVLKTESNSINGAIAFELYDTYGFPLDLTRLIAQEQGKTVDEAGFESEMAKQKNRSRAATALDTEDWIQVNNMDSVQFVGYEHNACKTSIIKYRKVTAKGKESYQLVLEKTPFYAESGGQIGDTGYLKKEQDTIIITNTKKENDLIIHFTDALPSSLEGTFDAQIDTAKRLQTTLHHSATHLMHAALQQVLGKHVAQKGSLNSDAILRFDFSHFAKMTAEEIRTVEQLVNEKIRAAIPVVIKEMSKDEALAIGATALFGEKYGDRVRVVIMDPNYSIELCGGTHVSNTGAIGLFKIQSESAVAAGVRRIEAVCGALAEAAIAESLQELDTVKTLLKNPKDTVKAIENLQSELSTIKKQLEVIEQQQWAVIAQDLANKAMLVNNKKFIGAALHVSNADALKKICSDLRAHAALIVVVASIDGKAQIAVGVDDAHAQEFNAATIIKQHIAPLIKGGGGGQSTLATAGGQDVSKLQDIITVVKGLL
ncbi:MAG: hypothetical protein RLZ39_845 [Bacteroidota bacterium]|jgi:alanyl-tRNA synthetase